MQWSFDVADLIAGAIEAKPFKLRSIVSRSNTFYFSVQGHQTHPIIRRLLANSERGPRSWRWTAQLCFPFNKSTIESDLFGEYKRSGIPPTSSAPHGSDTFSLWQESLVGVSCWGTNS